MKTVAVIFGGRSAEHDVSIITAHVPIIESLLASKKYDVIPVYVSKEGLWYSEAEMNDLSYFKDNFEERISVLKPVQVSLGSRFELIRTGVFQKRIPVDIVFPSMHGTYGEDGSLMGVLRMANVPFVGCDIFASAVAMDKVLTKEVVAAEGMDVVPYVWFTADEWKTASAPLRARAKELGFPVFVKPVHLGSSIGITKVATDEELENAIEVALHFDDKVLVEKGIEDLIEITLPMMGASDPLLASLERPLNKTELFSFSDKYLSGGEKGSGGVNTQYSEIPAQIDDALAEKVKSIARKVWRVLGASGIARVDFLIDKTTGTVYVNEVNTLPGSLYHHNWRKSGIPSMELVLRLVELAEERFASQKDIVFTFRSNILKKIGGAKMKGNA